MKKFFTLISVFLLIIFTTKNLYAVERQYFFGTIVNAKSKINNKKFKEIVYQIQLPSKKIVEIKQSYDDQRRYQIGEKVVVSITNDQYFIEDRFRLNKIFLLLVIFLVTTFLVIGKNSFGVIFSIFFSLFVLFTSVIPNIVAGYNPIVAAIFGSLIIIPFTFFFSHGFNKKTFIAISGTIIALVVTGILSYLSSIYLKITGTTSEEIYFFKFLTQKPVDFFGVYVAGVIIALTGILDDITVTQVSIVWELKKNLKTSSWLQIYKKAMSVGKDHLKSIINTIIIIYIGTNLPLILLLFLFKNDISFYLNYEIFAQEIVRSLISTIGLLLSVPITTLIATKANN